ncbi:tubulin-specific chaperone D [Plutella xylostella]|uniref:tubulin-specific chaperone D n=1 Tax=Plutella xylostella TaxID=51655 RepID=UPI0020323EEA|nr:tubulin-specific chaperone D [Plutella xylostella]
MVGLDAEHLDEDCDNIGLGCALEHFAEVDEVLDMIDNLKNIYDKPEVELQYDKLYNILKQYYEQPHLLDPHLEKILSKFLVLIKEADSPMKLKDAVFNYMYQIVRVRGYKVVVRHLPHEVSDLLMVLSMLEAHDDEDKECWRSRFVLLLWLSIVVIIPFHMSRLDGFAPGAQDDASTKQLTVMERIFNICKKYALSRDTCAEASAYLASKFFIRGDVKEVYLGPFFEWACNLQTSVTGESTIHYGVLAAVAAVLKHGKRDDLLPYAPKLLEWVAKLNFRQSNAMLVRKYGVKIVQRIGLTYLRARAASWRYTVGARSLSGALRPHASGDTAPAAPEAAQPVPTQVEDVVELLLCSLRDDDTVVRWSAAKGLGRIGARLSAEAAADVAESVLTLFDAGERDLACHGGCMAIAELARRGLLSPEQLGASITSVCAALARDEPRCGGTRAARDAACHAAWAFARAYSPEALKPYAGEVANGLIATACFDREINVRRAASAAYQENVGRHGLFPRGIDVLTAADFQAVGPRAHAYLEVAPYVASFPEYTIPLIDHLVDLKTEHWDCAIRELSAKALHKLTHKAPEYVATTVLPKLVSKTQSIDLNVRHGAILALGEAIHALAEAELPDGTRADKLIPPSVLTSVHGLVSGLRARRQLLGLGGELVRAAACQCVAALSRARVPLPAAAVQDWIQLLEECLEHEVSSIRDHAVAAMPCVFTQYLQPDDLEYEGGTAKEKRVQLLEKYCEQLSNTGVNGLLLRMGYAKAIGSLPKFVLSDSCAHVIRSLIECTKVSPPTAKWAEARRDAALALSAVLQTTDRLDLAPEVIAALLEALDEYTVDMRGDIGAWVREASMTGLLSVCRQCAVSAPEVLTPDVVSGIMTRLAQQAVEKIDRTRALAGRIFTAFIYNDPVIPNIPHHEELKEIFPPEDVELKPLVQKPDTDEPAAPSTQYNNTVLWLFPGHTMPRFTRLLACETYRPRLLLGLAVSGGERSDTLVKHTTQSLFAFLRSADLPLLQEICRELTAIFTRHLHDRRVSQPMFNLLERLLSSGAISPILDDPTSTFAADVLKYVQLELRGGKHWYKLLDSINVLCQLVQVGGEVCRKSLGQLVIYLCYSECYVRRCAAARLYEALALYGDVSCVPPSNQDQVMEVLAETDWERDVTELRPIRNELCDLMGIKRPLLKQKPAAAAAP